MFVSLTSSSSSGRSRRSTERPPSRTNDFDDVDPRVGVDTVDRARLDLHLAAAAEPEGAPAAVSASATTRISLRCFLTAAHNKQNKREKRKKKEKQK
jgi:hypothetical protein